MPAKIEEMVLPTNRWETEDVRPVASERRFESIAGRRGWVKNWGGRIAWIWKLTAVDLSVRGQWQRPQHEDGRRQILWRESFAQVRAHFGDRRRILGFRNDIGHQ